MSSNPWRRKLRKGTPEKSLAAWLSEPGSLTARCQRHCRQFCVRVQRSGLLQPMADKYVLHHLVKGREVLLECDGQAVIFAHTTMLTASNGQLTRWLAGLASRSLGSLLFTRPGFKRGPLEFRKFKAGEPLYQRAAPWAAGAPELWARRSVHRFGNQSLCVTEVFLPGIVRLGASPAQEIEPESLR